VNKLDLNGWRRCVTLPADYVAPGGTSIRMALDCSPTAGPQSDESAITVGHFMDVEKNAEDVEVVPASLLDCIAGRWAGMALPDRVVSETEKWAAQQVFIECYKQHGGELMVDAIKFRAEVRGVPTGHIITFSASNRANSKIRRIRRIEDQLVSNDPPLLKIRLANFVDKLFSEVESFTFDPGNHGRADSCLDSLSYLCFGRPRPQGWPVNS
jgi:hypothetical protein